MSNISVGIGRGQMQVLDDRVALRRNMNAFYVKLFKDIPNVTVFTPPNEDYFANHYAIVIEPDLIKGLDREKLE